MSSSPYEITTPSCRSFTTGPDFKGAYMHLSNVTLSPCKWLEQNAAGKRVMACTSAPVAEHPDSAVVDAMRVALHDCNNMGWFKASSEGGIPDKGIIVRQGTSHVHAHKPPQDTAVLIDSWGTTSLYHAVIDVVFTAAATVHAHYGRHDWCGARDKQCGLFLLSRHAWLPHNSWTVEVSKLMFGGDGIQQADSIVAGTRYNDVLVGSLISAYQVLKYPDVSIHKLRYRPLLRPAWEGFVAAIRARLVHTGVVPSHRYAHGHTRSSGNPLALPGVWIRRDASPDTEKEQRRRLSDDEASLLAGMTKKWMRIERMHTLTFADQARLMSTTRLLTGMEGAGFVNQLFMPPGGTIVIVSPFADERGYQWGYGQYMHNRLVYVSLRKTPLSLTIAEYTGKLLNAVAAGCAKLPQLPTGLAVHDIRYGEDLRAGEVYHNPDDPLEDLIAAVDNQTTASDSATRCERTTSSPLAGVLKLVGGG